MTCVLAAIQMALAYVFLFYGRIFLRNTFLYGCGAIHLTTDDKDGGFDRPGIGS